MNGLISIARVALRHAVFGVLLIVVAATASGCQLFGALVETTDGDNPIKAEYKPAQVPLVVVVENYDGSSSVDAEALAGYIEAEIKGNKVAPVVDREQVEVLRSAQPTAFHQMKVDDIAKAVGAKQVLYVDRIVDSLDRPQASDMIQGDLIVNARIVSADTGDTIWPSGAQQGMQFKVTAPFTPQAQTDPSDLRGKLAQDMALKIVNMFHDHQPVADDVDRTERP